MTGVRLFARPDRGAEFSPCRTWRYSLWRYWGNPENFVAFVGLNPSTADEEQDDPTIRRCMDFAKRWGHEGIVMLNLFAFRATDPRVMKRAADPIGPENDAAIQRFTRLSRVNIVCWGAHGKHIGRGQQVISLCHGGLGCFGVTKHGHPKHPLYLPADTMIVPFSTERTPNDARPA